MALRAWASLGALQKQALGLSDQVVIGSGFEDSHALDPATSHEMATHPA
jgi:hypothetical protein